ncbi:hypothetical protein GCM10010277_83190 [Streptomyces longisporoflavus]|nr:hypothetical protein GCM10010277_83190 [Streptomyces longisporoflavus]
MTGRWLARQTEGEAAQWSVTEYLVTHVVHQPADTNWMFATVSRYEDADPPRPAEAVAATGRRGPLRHARGTEPSPASTATPTAQQSASFFS